MLWQMEGRVKLKAIIMTTVAAHGVVWFCSLTHCCQLEMSLLDDHCDFSSLLCQEMAAKKLNQTTGTCKVKSL